jgi:uncharacterized protein (DUF983 family)
MAVPPRWQRNPPEPARAFKVAVSIFTMLGHGLRLRCPRCGIGRLYGKPFRMNENCAHCGLKFEREQGYFIGAIYINYAATIAIAVPGFFLLDAFTGIDINQQLAFWIPFAVIFPLLFFHHSRSLWLVLDHICNPEKQLFSVTPRKSTDK